MIATTINKPINRPRPTRTVSQITEKPDILISKDTSVPNVIKPDLDIPLNRFATSRFGIKVSEGDKAENIEREILANLSKSIPQKRATRFSR